MIYIDHGIGVFGSRKAVIWEEFKRKNVQQIPGIALLPSIYLHFMKLQGCMLTNGPCKIIKEVVWLEYIKIFKGSSCFRPEASNSSPMLHLEKTFDMGDM